MKKILTFLLLAVGVQASAQKIGGYVSVSGSLSNGNSLADAAYFMVEGGITKGDISAGVGLGRSNFNFSQKDRADNYFVEPKVMFKLLEKGNLKGYGIFGAGTYFNSTKFFIEYGAGATVSLKNVDLSVQFSDWDGKGYVSLGVTKCF